MNVVVIAASELQPGDRIVKGSVRYLVKLVRPYREGGLPRIHVQMEGGQRVHRYRPDDPVQVIRDRPDLRLVK